MHYRRILSGAVTQILSSVANLVFNLALARQVSPESYGIFAIGFASMLLAAGLAQAAFLTPMTFHTAGKSKAYNRTIQRRTLKLLTAISGLTFPIVIAAGFLLWSNVEQRNIFAIFSLIGFANIFREFFVRCLLDRKSFVASTLSNLSFLGVMTTLEILLLMLGSTDLVDHLAAYLVALATAVVAASSFAKLNPFAFPKGSDARLLCLLLRSGKWSCITTIAFNIRTQAPNLFAFGFIGLTGIAQLNSHRILVSPLLLIIPAITPTLLRTLAESHQHSTDNQGVSTGKLAATAMAIGTTYTCALAIIYPTLLYHIFPKYKSDWLILLGWGVYGTTVFARSIFDVSIQAKGNFRSASLASTGISAISIPIAILLSWAFAERGALLSIIVAEAMLLITLAQVSRK
ncbi:hypothetical protein JAK51_19215 [Stenotrophomonas maltophilia]|uniref:lipopolysaccharide biosynthesis protein n=1 Tax=Stenotrophomonas maltophilia TaxID=40324 RepID=UPI0021C926A1|nr:hypothetical protein [Stenotrophomonas maltophilia]MCU1128336.1 hypothetical protein [Stenotrophomonas maltophilia]